MSFSCFFFSSITINKCVCAIEFTVSFLRKVLIFIISFVFCKIPDPRFPLSRFPVVHHSPLSVVSYRFVSLFFFFFFVKIYILWFRTDRINIYGFVFSCRDTINAKTEKMEPKIEFIRAKYLFVFVPPICNC